MVQGHDERQSLAFGHLGIRDAERYLAKAVDRDVAVVEAQHLDAGQDVRPVGAGHRDVAVHRHRVVGEVAGEDRHVGIADPAVEAVVARAAGQRVVALVADQGIVDVAAGNRIVALAAEGLDRHADDAGAIEVVAARAAEKLQRVVRNPARGKIALGDHAVRAGAALDDDLLDRGHARRGAIHLDVEIGPAAGDREVAALFAARDGQGIGIGPAIDLVAAVARGIVDRIAAWTGVDGIVAGAAGDVVVAGPGVDDVVAAGRVDHVVAGAGIDHIGTFGAGEARVRIGLRFGRGRATVVARRRDGNIVEIPALVLRGVRRSVFAVARSGIAVSVGGARHTFDTGRPGRAGDLRAEIGGKRGRQRRRHRFGQLLGPRQTGARLQGLFDIEAAFLLFSFRPAAALGLLAPLARVAVFFAAARGREVSGLETEGAERRVRGRLGAAQQRLETGQQVRRGGEFVQAVELALNGDRVVRLVQDLRRNRVLQDRLAGQTGARIDVVDDDPAIDVHGHEGAPHADLQHRRAHGHAFALLQGDLARHEREGALEHREDHRVVAAAGVVDQLVEDHAAAVRQAEGRAVLENEIDAAVGLGLELVAEEDLVAGGEAAGGAVAGGLNRALDGLDLADRILRPARPGLGELERAVGLDQRLDQVRLQEIALRRQEPRRLGQREVAADQDREPVAALQQQVVALAQEIRAEQEFAVWNLDGLAGRGGLDHSHRPRDVGPELALITHPQRLLRRGSPRGYH